MKAIRYHAFGGPEVLRLEDAPMPALRPGDVLVEVHAAAVNPVDSKIRDGARRDRYAVALPHTPGRDYSGVVMAVGAEVGEFAVGDEVWGAADRLRPGSYAEYVAVDAAEVGRKPPGLDHVAAASLPLVGLSAHIPLVGCAAIRRGQKVLVHGGAGGVGGFAVQLAKHIGCHVAATCGAGNVDHVRGLGADEVIDYTARDFAEIVHDYDCVFDTIGGDVHDRSYAVLRRGGHLVRLNGLPVTDRAEEFGVTITLATIVTTTALLDAIAALVADGAVTPQIRAVRDLADAADAHREIMRGHGRGKIVLKLR